MPNYLMLALDSALSVFGIRSIYEQPRYEVTERIGAVEIRAYAPRLAAETTVPATSEKEGRREAFHILARYIFGGNLQRTDMSMTTPVATGAAGVMAKDIPMTTPVPTSGRPGSTTMRFFLPGKITRDDAPVPTDARVKIVQVPEETIAALTFSGRGTEAVLTEKKCALVEALAGSRWRAIEEPYTLFYDPPFTIPFLRRNEVVVRVVTRD
jgi:hypothetical protein